MGLDMYLYAERYVSGWNHEPDNDEQVLYKTILDLLGMERNDDSPHIEVKVCVGYWRKANAVHGWFVDNVQGGIDECQTSHVEREQLLTLRSLAAQALAAYEVGDKDRAAGLLNPRAGFFFGSTKVDEWYGEDLRSTITIIDRAMKLEGVTFYYHSSW